MFYLVSKLQVMILNIHQCQNVKNIYLLRFFPFNFSMFSLSVRRHRTLTKQRVTYFYITIKAYLICVYIYCNRI